MKIRQKTSVKHQDFLVWCYKASDDNFDKLYFPWIYLRSRIAKIYDDQNLTFLDSHRLSIFYSLKNHNDLSHLFTWSNLRNKKKEIFTFFRCRKCSKYIIVQWSIYGIKVCTFDIENEIFYVWFIYKNFYQDTQSFYFYIGNFSFLFLY